VFAASCDTVEAAFGVLNTQRGFSNRMTYYFGKNGKLLFVDKEDNVREHGAEVVEKLAELGVAKKQ
jgi:peroxiredoxin